MYALITDLRLLCYIFSSGRRNLWSSSQLMSSHITMRKISPLLLSLMLLPRSPGPSRRLAIWLVSFACSMILLAVFIAPISQAVVCESLVKALFLAASVMLHRGPTHLRYLVTVEHHIASKANLHDSHVTTLRV